MGTEVLDVLDAVEAAAVVGAHVETVRRLARRGAIPAFKVGKDWRFRRSALEAWALGQSAAPAAAPLVLVVDDEEPVRRVHANMVERLGARALAAADGEEGLAAVERARPDAVLLDLLMPRMDGPAFLERLRQLDRALPVVLVTGYPDSAAMARALEHGPFLLLRKPVERSELELALRVVLGSRLPPQQLEVG